jgi:tetratricopeptide (TPR) repeat protein
MPQVKRKPVRISIERLMAAGIAVLFYSGMLAHAQMPYINAGSDSAFARLDLAQTYLDTMNRDSKAREDQQKHNQELVDSGLVSALDLAAPNNAIDEFNRANSLLKAQKSKEAMKPLRKAILDYPNFVSAHVALGVACVDQEDNTCARSEFETAAKLDDKFALAFLRLGQLWLSLSDFGAAQTALEKAVSLSPNDLAALSRLVYAQHGAREYRRALETTRRMLSEKSTTPLRPSSSGSWQW